MNTTCIYGLFDPRNPDVIMYVGKGLEERAKSHWKNFLSTKKPTVNVILHRWFEQLKTEVVEPGWRFLEENVEDWPTREKHWISYFRGLGQAGCNISAGGDGSRDHEFGRKMGKLNGGIAFRRAWKEDRERMYKLSLTNLKHTYEIASAGGRASGGKAFKRLWETDRERMLLTAKKASDTSKAMGSLGASKAGKIGGKIVHQLHPNLASENGKKRMRIHPNPATPESCSRAGLIGSHNRWHVNTNNPNPKCVHCRPEFFDLWEGGFQC
jgi:hypothetical protein